MPLLRAHSLTGTQLREEAGRRWWDESALYTEKGWEKGWSLDGYPYLASTGHFLSVPPVSSGASVAPAWAPRYAYPAAFSGRPATGSSSVGQVPRSPRSKISTDPAAEVYELIQDGEVKSDPLDPAGLPDAALKALDSLEAAFQRSDPESLMTAVRELGEVFDQSLLASRAEELLGSTTGDTSLRKCRNSKIAALESEILKRFAKAFAQRPERTKEFVQRGLPEQLLAPLQRHRMRRVVREMTSASKGLQDHRGSLGSSQRQPSAEPPMPPMPPYQLPGAQPAPAAPQRAVTPCHLSNKDEAQLSQAVLKLPWSGNQQWERRWEQDVIWHPGILYGSHQALPQQR